MNIEEIIDSNYQRVYKLCLYYLKDESESEELTQEVFLRVFKKKSTFKEESDIYTWIYRIAVNTVLNHIRRKKIVQFISFEASKEKGETEIASVGGDPARKLEEVELREIQMKKLEQAIGLLSNREKTAFYFFHYDGLKQKQIAEIMNTPLSAVESLVHKAIKKIKSNVEEQR